MKKTVFIIIAVAVLGLAFYYYKNIYGWMEFRKNTDTPDEFLSKTLNKKEDYTKDSLMIAVEFDSFETNHTVIQKCLTNGIITDWFLFGSQCMRIAPPLVISIEEINKACEIIMEACNKV